MIHKTESVLNIVGLFVWSIMARDQKPEVLSAGTGWNHCFYSSLLAIFENISLYLMIFPNVSPYLMIFANTSPYLMIFANICKYFMIHIWHLFGDICAMQIFWRDICILSYLDPDVTHHSNLQGHFWFMQKWISNTEETRAVLDPVLSHLWSLILEETRAVLDPKCLSLVLSRTGRRV